MIYYISLKPEVGLDNIHIFPNRGIQTVFSVAYNTVTNYTTKLVRHGHPDKADAAKIFIAIKTDVEIDCQQPQLSSQMPT